MKISLSISLLVLSGQFAFGQTVAFNKSAYSTGENIKALVTGDLLGIESDIKKSSYSASAGNLDLGSSQTPGFSRVDFKFKNNITKSYLLGILPPATPATESYVLEVTNPAASIQGNTITKMFDYFHIEKNNLLDVSQRSVKKFGTENAVGLILNASFCITTVSGQPAVFVICRSLSVSNLKKLGLEMMKGYLVDMKDKQYLSEKEYNILIAAFALGQIGAIVNNNCSLLFKSLKALSESPDLKIAIGYFEQQCKTTVVILEKVKIP
ncbi:hypothetical protein J2Y38_000448 [Flavobacterium sp. 2755]|uniref:hypothetical protein n=1 Tax=Flavobacterium sp. 2755 TaxID=2817765 RepID=UPI00286312F2|nr:hypothetical protein [Flavobacterium sp. 2755]MDR6760269.1 hypothetical protein [Flavobacterium sp. 2755]